jgi:hypothetical protein
MLSYHIADGFESDGGGVLHRCPRARGHHSAISFDDRRGTLALLRLTGSAANLRPLKTRMITVSTNERSARFRQVGS